jgi:hypothetical protein
MQEIESPILEKIQKLLNLQKGAEAIGSLHEAELAAQRVTDLLLKYNLDMEDVTSFQKPDAKNLQRFDETGIVNPKNEGQWVHSLYNVIARHNFCRVIKIGQRDAQKDYIVLIGTKDNVTSVKFLSEQLDNRIRIVEKDAWRKNTSDEKRNAFRRGFFMGAVRGIDLQLTEKRKQEEAANTKVTTLVVTNKNALETFINQEFNHLRRGKTRSLSAANGYAQGHATGKSMSINKGVGTSTNNHKHLN